MKIWTQEEYNATPRTERGVELGTGDFRQIHFRSRHAVIIGPNSMIGEDAKLGVGCEIGSGSQIGARFSAGESLRVGKHCHFGENAQIGDEAIIERGCCFATGVAIGANAQLGDDVQLPVRCAYLFDIRARHADGRKMMKLTPVVGQTLSAFPAYYEGRYTVCVTSRGTIETITSLCRFAEHQVRMAEKTGSERDVMDAYALMDAAEYIKTRFLRMGIA